MTKKELEDLLAKLASMQQVIQIMSQQIAQISLRLRSIEVVEDSSDSDDDNQPVFTRRWQ